MIAHCPDLHAVGHNGTVAQHHHQDFLSLFRLCDIPSFSHLDPQDRVRVMLGNPPTVGALLKKNLRIWSESAPALCAKLSYDLLVAISAQVPPLSHDPSGV